MRRDPNADISDERLKASANDSNQTLDEKKRLAGLKEEAQRKEAGKEYDAKRKAGKVDTGVDAKKAEKGSVFSADDKKSGVSKSAFTADSPDGVSKGKGGKALDEDMDRPRTIDEEFRSGLKVASTFLMPLSLRFEQTSYDMKTASVKADDGDLRGGRSLNVMENLFGPRTPAPGLRFAPAAPGLAGPGGMGGGYSAGRGFVGVDTRDIEKERSKRMGLGLEGTENREDVEAKMRYARTMMGIKPGMSLKHDLSQGPKGPTHVIMTDGGTA
jgi:hypothetical protein